MWLSGQQKRPVDQGEGQVGVITMSGGETAALLDCERRGLQVYGPGGYRWTPKVGQKVLVIQGKGEIPCVVGAKQDGDLPDGVTVEARRMCVRGDEAELNARGRATVQGERIDLNGEVYVNDETLEELIIRLILMILGSL